MLGPGFGKDKGRDTTTCAPLPRVNVSVRVGRSKSRLACVMKELVGVAAVKTFYVYLIELKSLEPQAKFIVLAF